MWPIDSKRGQMVPNDAKQRQMGPKGVKRGQTRSKRVLLGKTWPKGQMAIFWADFMVPLRAKNLQCLMYFGAEFSDVYSTMLG